MEEQISFVVRFSLEEMALRRYFINLWCETDVLSSIEWQKFQYLRKGVVPFECHSISYELMEKKISNLALPVSLKKRMLVLIKPVGTDIVRWKVFHEGNFNWPSEHLDMNILKQLCWTAAGNVDYSKTAEKLLHLDGVSAETRYKLAAVYCLHDYLPDLWSELPMSYCDRYFCESPFVESRVKLDFCWAYILTGRYTSQDMIPLLPSGESFLIAACKYSALSGNKAAAEFFFKRLTNEERNSFSIGLVCSLIVDRDRASGWRPFDFPIEKRSEVVCFLLTQMSMEHQKNLLSEEPYKIFRCFLDWPFQGLCLQLFDVFQRFLSEGDYILFMKEMTQNMDHINHYSPDFLQEFFRISPSIFKNIFVSLSDFHFRFFTKLFNADDMQTIKSIFKSLGPDRRFTVISREKFLIHFEILINSDKYHLVKFCLKEALESEDQISRLQKTYMKFLDSPHDRLRKRKWRQIFRDISKDFASDNSESDISGETGAKKPCRYNLRTSTRKER